MTQEVQSSALELVNQQLGLKGRGAQNTQFEDAFVAQMFSVNSAVRRSRAIGQGGGWFYGQFEHLHVAAGAITSVWNPYATGENGAIDPFPATLPPGFDIWIDSIAHWPLVGSGAGTINSDSHVSMIASTSNQGVGLDNSGAAVERNGDIPLAIWDIQLALANLVRAFVNSTTNASRQPVKMRWPRGGASPSLLSFESDMDNSVTVLWDVIYCVVPIGMGQNIAP